MASVYRVATLAAAEGFGLKDRGLIAPGRKADIVLLRDLKNCDVLSVIKDGKAVAPECFDTRPAIAPVGYRSVKIDPVSAEDFTIKSSGGVTDVIGVAAGRIVTDHLQETMTPGVDGCLYADPVRDLLKIAVVERHGKNANIARGFVKGFGFGEGAIASSIGHDSHNITVVGASDEDMAAAVNRLKDIQGGFVVVRGGVVEGELSLPIAGLMSDQAFEDVRDGLLTLREAVNVLGSSLHEPLLMMAFLPLCVIPELKLTDFGLVRFNPAKGDEEPILIRDQRGSGLRVFTQA